MQGLPGLSSKQSALLAALNVADLITAKSISEQLSKDELYALVIALHQNSTYRSQTSTDHCKPSIPQLPLEWLESHAEGTNTYADTGGCCEGSAATEHGGEVTLLAVGNNNSSTETPRLVFCESNPGSARNERNSSEQQQGSSYYPPAKKQIVQRVIAAGAYDTKASLDLQVGDSVADFDLLASRLGGVGCRLSVLGPGSGDPAAATALTAPAADGTLILQHSPGPSDHEQERQEVYQSSSQAYHSSSCMVHSSATVELEPPPGSLADVDYEAELTIPSCSSSPREAPSSCNQSSSQHQSLVRQSAADMRASALVGPTSIMLDDVRDGDDTGSEPTTPASRVAVQAAAYPAITPSATPASRDREGSLCSTPSTIGSSISQRQGATTPTEAKSRGGGGLGKVLFGPVNALRRSFTGNRDPKKTSATASTSKRTPGSTATTSTAVGEDSASCAVVKVQSRLPSFTATAGATPGGSRKGGSAGTPSTGYRPPSSASIASSRVAAATSRSPLGKQTQNSRMPAGAARQAGSSSASAGLAWLQQQRDTPSPAPVTHNSRDVSHRTSSKPAAHAAAEAAAALIGAAGFQSAPVTPMNSRPGTSLSVHSVASAATYAGSSSRRTPAGGSSNSSRIPGFSVTQQMVASKQQRSTPPSSSRTAATASARSATSTATTSSTAAFMRQISSVAGGAPGAAALARTGSRLPSFGGTPQPSTSTGTGAGNKIGAGATPHTMFAGAAAAAGRRQGSRCDAVLDRKSSRIGSGAVSNAGKGAAAGGGSQLRRSRSFGSLGELIQQSNQQDVSQIRQMWQKRAAAHKLEQIQQQQTGKAAMQRQRPAATTGPAAARALKMTVKQVSLADGHVSGIPAPEECESPTVLKQQGRSSSSCGRDISTGGATDAAVGYVPASELLGRLDDILEKAKTPAARTPVNSQHTTPASAPPAHSSVSAATDSGSSGSRWSGRKAVVSPASDTRLIPATGMTALQAAVSTLDSGKHGPGVNPQVVQGAVHRGPDQLHQQLTATDSLSAGRDQQLGARLTVNNDSINRQLF